MIVSNRINSDILIGNFYHVPFHFATTVLSTERPAFGAVPSEFCFLPMGGRERTQLPTGAPE